MINMNNNLFCTVFFINNVSGKPESWVHVSNLDNQDIASHQMDAFCINHNISNFSNAFIIPESVFNAVLLPVIREIREVLNDANDIAPISEIKYEMIPEAWVETDDDCHQCVRKNKNKTYDFVQVVQSPQGDDKFYVVADQVSVEDILDCRDENEAEFYCGILSGYGYDTALQEEYEYDEVKRLSLILGEIKKTYGSDKYLQIVAEIMFENASLVCPDEYVVYPQNPVTWEEAVLKANEYMWKMEAYINE